MIAGNQVGYNGIVTSNAPGAQCAGSFAGSGGVVVEDQPGTDCSITGGTTEPADALIGILADNGGPTQTVELLSRSPAIGFAGSCSPTDQRGVARPITGCDSGAFERAGP